MEPADETLPEPVPARLPAVYEVVFSRGYGLALWQRLRQTHRSLRLLRAVKYLMGILLAGGLGLTFFLHGRGIWTPRLTLLFFLLLLMFSAQLDNLVRAWRWRKSPFRDRRVRFTFDEAGVRIVTDLSESTTRWPVFDRARRFPDGTLLCMGSHGAYWLPDAGLVSGSAEEAARLMAAHVAGYQAG